MTYDANQPDIMLVRYGQDGSERIVKDTTMPTIVPVGKCPGVPHRGHTDPLKVCPMNVTTRVIEDEAGTLVETTIDGYLPPGHMMYLDATLDRGIPGEPFAVMFGDAVPATDDQVARIEVDEEIPPWRIHVAPSMGEAGEQASDHYRATNHETRVWIQNHVEGAEYMWQCESCDGPMFGAPVPASDHQIEMLEMTPEEDAQRLHEHIRRDREKMAYWERHAHTLGDELRVMRISEQANKDGWNRTATELREKMAVIRRLDAQLVEVGRQLSDADANVERLSARNVDLTYELANNNPVLNGFVLGGRALSGKQCPNRMEAHWPHVWGPPGTEVWSLEHARYCAGVR